MELSPASWEWKVLILIIVGILVIVGVIWYSYIQTNKADIRAVDSQQIAQSNAEGFKTYSDLVTELNTNRGNLLAISKVQNQALLDIDPNVSDYIQAENIFTDDLKKRLNANFDIRFSQKLQDTELQDLQGQLEKLKQKMKKLPALPTNYMLKNLGGSAFQMLGTPNDFSLQINPKNAQCLGVSKYGFDNPVNPDSLNKVYNSARSTQCDIGGGDKSQRFKLTEIKNNQDFNNLLGDARDALAVPEYYTLNNYPFMVAQPVNGTLRSDGMIDECITFDNSGLSVEPCTGSENQRWHTYSVSN